MGLIIGLDIGGSTTKLVGMRSGSIVYKFISQHKDPVAAVYGAIGKLINDLDLPLTEIDQINMTGVGSGFSTTPILGIETKVVQEFKSTGLGGLYISGIKKAVVVSMGTGTAFVRVEGNKVEHIIGSGVGGGTLIGLSNSMIGIDSPVKLSEIASEGDLDRVDLTIGDISKDPLPGLDLHITASNFGKNADDLTNGDKITGIFNLVYQTIGTMSVLTSMCTGIKDIVFTGQLTKINNFKKYLERFPELYDVNFIIPDNSEFATAIGACLCGEESEC